MREESRENKLKHGILGFHTFFASKELESYFKTNSSDNIDKTWELRLCHSHSLDARWSKPKLLKF